jgi:hypothetical protein
MVVSVSMAAVIIMAAGSGAVKFTLRWLEGNARQETQQRLRDAAQMVSRAMRLAGACLPRESGPLNVRPLGGSNVGTTDSITIRLNARCASATVTSAFDGGGNVVTVDDVSQFVPGMQAYILHEDNSVGRFFRILSVDAGAGTLVVHGDTPIPEAYPVNSSVYGAEAQTFSVATLGGVPTLTMATSVDAAEPAVRGVETFNLTYILNRAYDVATCAGSAGGYCQVSVPASDTDWSLVRTVNLTITVRSPRRLMSEGGDGYYRLTETLQLKPRNFVF